MYKDYLIQYISWLCRYLVKNIQQMKKSTKNSSQVDYFSSLKDVWWKPEVGGMLEKYNFVRVPFVCNGLVPISSRHDKGHPLKDKEILDVGCGGGVLSEDGVVASEVIEHVNDPQLFVKCCVRTLKPGGKLFFTTPNRTRISQFVFIFLFENVFKSIPKGMHQYDKFITPTELIFILEQNNCRMEKFCGILYNPFTKQFRYTKYPHILYAIQAQKIK